jgi:hypothetical protein
MGQLPAAWPNSRCPASPHPSLPWQIQPQSPTPNNASQPPLAVPLHLQFATPLGLPPDAAAQCQAELHYQRQEIPASNQANTNAVTPAPPSDTTRIMHGGIKLPRRVKGRPGRIPAADDPHLPSAGRQASSSPGPRGSSQTRHPRMQQDCPPPAPPQPDPSAAARTPGGRVSFLRSGLHHAVGKHRSPPSLLHPARSCKESAGSEVSPQVKEAPSLLNVTAGGWPGGAREAPPFGDFGLIPAPAPAAARLSLFNEEFGIQYLP